MHVFIPKALTRSLGVFDPWGNAVAFTLDLLSSLATQGTEQFLLLWVNPDSAAKPSAGSPDP